MGQKVHPKGFRVGVYRDWDARWFARGSYGKLLLEDLAIRRMLDQILEHAELARVEIEKASDNVRIIIHSGRPGVVIGKKGQEIENLRAQLASTLKKNVEVSVQEVKTPEMDATLVAKNIVEQLLKRVSYKRAMKKAAISSVRSGAKGIKICCSGRLQGAEIARREWTRMGSVPLHTLRSDIDYGVAQAKTTYGIIGVKVWIYKGEYQLS
ncbi:30S ribosomal protein S3 [Candidatus Dependentiae bacterium HGW-Dependentiae-1]|nr:MAG: 30S ribosomal protein S3 [Candidatus Dependentiae bacterium HGW-Dependentiae-1]